MTPLRVAPQDAPAGGPGLTDTEEPYPIEAISGDLVKVRVGDFLQSDGPSPVGSTEWAA